MSSRTPEILERRHAELLEEICVFIEQGQPPWWNQTAQLGPAMLGRSGQSLRGLPALIAWHVGERYPGRPLAWRLQPLAKVDTTRAAVFRLAANGGDALYAALPDTRPQELLDSPTEDLLAYWPLERLDRQLDGILRFLGTMAPDLEADRSAILSLAQAFIRPLGDPREPTRTALGGPWTATRLARVAAWARLLADDVRLAVQLPLRWSDRDPPRWPYRLHLEYQRMLDDNESFWLLRERVRQDIDSLLRSGWLQHCLPAEVRARAEVATDARHGHAQGHHLVPEQPVRVGLIHAKPLWRAPALGGLRGGLVERTFVRQRPVAWAMHEMGWSHRAAFGLVLAEALAGPVLPSEPGLAWRLIGQRARVMMQRGHVEARFAQALRAAGMGTFWSALHRHHLLKTWFHPTSRAPLQLLVASERWRLGDLETLLARQRLSGWHDGGSEYLARDLPVVHVATLRRCKRETPHDEVSVRGRIASALGCADDWSAVGSAVGSGVGGSGVAGATVPAMWQRHKRAKRSGGVRWLDVPCEPLRAAQRVVSDVLYAVSPGAGAPTAFHPGASPALHARVHAGASAAVRMDLADFFGSVRPWHLEPWLGLGTGKDANVLADWSREGRQTLLSMIFLRRDGRPPYLPQGAPSSPAAANLAAAWLDHAIIHHARAAFGAGNFAYTRYADDLVLSTTDPALADRFVDAAHTLLRAAVADQRWRVQPSKTRTWTHRDGDALHVCGIRVPRDASAPLTLGRETWRRARAALHRMRHREDFDLESPDSPTAAHGLLAYAYSATADLRWLAYTSRRLQMFARGFAGPLFSESFLAGWSDFVEPVVTENRDAVL